MSEKATCPACNAHTSSVQAVLDGDKDACPYCGLSRGAMLEVLAAERRGADAALTAKYAEAAKRADVAEALARRLQRKLDSIKWTIEEKDDDDG